MTISGGRCVLLPWRPSPGRSPGREHGWVLVPQGDVVELAEYLHDLLLAALLAGGQPLRSLQVLQPAQALRLADHCPPSFRSWRAFFPSGARPSINRGTYSSTALRASQHASLESQRTDTKKLKLTSLQRGSNPFAILAAVNEPRGFLTV